MGCFGGVYGGQRTDMKLVSENKNARCLPRPYDHLTLSQLAAARSLYAALGQATRSGLLESIDCESPDSINDVCDTIRHLLESVDGY